MILTALLILTGACILILGAVYARAYTSMLASRVSETLLVLRLNEARPKGISAEGSSRTLLFAGDVMLSRGVAYQIKKHGDDPRYPFLRIADFLHSADLVFGNLENPISDRGRNQGSIYSFRAARETVQGLTFAGFNVLNLANNHIFDWGVVAFGDTLDLLEENKIRTIGAGRNETQANEPLMIDEKGMRIAFLGYTPLYPRSFEARGDAPGIAHFDLSRIEARIREIKSQHLAETVVISLHWGEEYRARANATQRQIAHALVDAGADLIVGHHPHVVEEVEAYHGAWIAYSMGNFVFDQNFSEETNRGILIQATVRGGKIIKVAQVPIRINASFQPEVNRL